MNRRPRIKDLSMSTMEVLVAMADGNPGALSAMMLLLEKGATIDPDSALGGLGNIMSLDTHGIYGPRIWMFYKDVCKQNLNHMIGLMRAVQLGYLSETTLSNAIDNDGEGLDIPALLAQVKDRLPRFVVSNDGKAAA
jgi:hypothetical protein